MTKTQLRKKYKEIRNHVPKMLDVYLEAALKSGSFDIGCYDDNYKLVKNIIHAGLTEIASQYQPIVTEDKKNVKNIQKTTYPDYTKIR
jgi:hypothetical protein